MNWISTFRESLGWVPLLEIINARYTKRVSEKRPRIKFNGSRRWQNHRKSDEFGGKIFVSTTTGALNWCAVAVMIMSNQLHKINWCVAEKIRLLPLPLPCIDDRRQNGCKFLFSAVRLSISFRDTVRQWLKVIAVDYLSFYCIIKSRCLKWWCTECILQDLIKESSVPSLFVFVFRVLRFIYSETLSFRNKRKLRSPTSTFCVL